MRLAQELVTLQELRLTTRGEPPAYCREGSGERVEEDLLVRGCDHNHCPVARAHMSIIFRSFSMRARTRVCSGVTFSRRRRCLSRAFSRFTSSASSMREPPLFRGPLASQAVPPQMRLRI